MKNVLVHGIRTALVAGALLSATTALAAPAAARPAADLFNHYCTACHTSGAAGAPKAGDAAAWKPRLAKGEAALLNSVKNGFNAMPPRGLCNDCTDDEYKSLIQYMSHGK